MQIAEPEIELVIPTQEGEIGLNELIAQRVLQAQPDIVASAIKAWLNIEKEYKAAASRAECPKEAALILYRGTKILLHRLGKWVENEAYWYGRGHSPIQQRFYETEKLSIQKQGEYYATKCECGQHRTKPKHINWCARRGITIHS